MKEILISVCVSGTILIFGAIYFEHKIKNESKINYGEVWNNVKNSSTK